MWLSANQSSSHKVILSFSGQEQVISSSNSESKCSSSKRKLWWPRTTNLGVATNLVAAVMFWFGSKISVGTENQSFAPELCHLLPWWWGPPLSSRQQMNSISIGRAAHVAGRCDPAVVIFYNHAPMDVQLHFGSPGVHWVEIPVLSV